MSGWMEPHAKTPPPPVLSPEVTATHTLELLASVLARTYVSDKEFVVEPVATPQPQALNKNPSSDIVLVKALHCASFSQIV